MLLIVLVTLALPATMACLYLLIHTLMSAKPRAPAASTRTLKFHILVPAHNEAGGIARTIENLRRIDWPEDRYRIVVVADNCSDETASLARAAGAQVLERHDTSRRGKGYALLYAFDRGLDEGWADAVAIVDADAQVTPNLLDAFASRLETGAYAVQAHYGIAGFAGAWRTRLLAIALAAYDIVRSRGRERQGVSCGIRGNGWCVSYELLRRIPYTAFSLTEDIEYGLELGLAGYRVHYAGEAAASQEMPTDAKVAGKQRQRWEFGRLQLVRSHTLRLLRTAWKQRSAVCLDLAIDLMVLPFTYVVINVVALFLVALLATWLNRHFEPWLAYSSACAAILLLYVMRGWSLSRTGFQGLLDLLGAPVFIVWKLLVMLGRRQNREWVRTERRLP
jgi:cellulose synthase/poly-beta-1,6-N-acetylglucosamine synthase-like glycosyltransferase